MLQIKLFGVGQAAYFGQPLAAFPMQQPYQVWCYLLIHGRYPVLRDKLASLFWGDYPTSVALKNLRNALWKLRQSFAQVGADLENYLLISDTSIAVRRASPYWLDVEVFETAVEACQKISGEKLNPAQAGLLEDAVALYTGDLLEGIYCDWCLYERERLCLLYLATLSKLASYCEHIGDWRRGLHYGESILARDNTRERVHLQMMRLYWMAGDRDAALAQYKRCCEILQDELGVAPMRETTQVYQQMANNLYPPPGLVVAAPSPAIRPPHSHSSDAQEKGVQNLAEKTLQRVVYLQNLLEETRAELHYLESLIHRELLNSNISK